MVAGFGNSDRNPVGARRAVPVFQQREPSHAACRTVSPGPQRTPLAAIFVFVGSAVHTVDRICNLLYSWDMDGATFMQYFNPSITMQYFCNRIT